MMIRITLNRVILKCRDETVQIFKCLGACRRGTVHDGTAKTGVSSSGATI